MADLSQTAANVRAASSSTKTRVVQFAETVVAGSPIIKLAGETKYRNGHADAASNKAEYAGQNGFLIAVNGGAADEFGAAVYEGDVDLGATLTVGLAYIMSSTAGAIAPIGDFAGYTDAYSTVLGIATATDNLRILSNGYTGANNVS